MSKNKLVALFNSIDIFGYPVQLNIRQDDKYTTAIGGTISLMIIVISILFFQSNVVQFLQKVNISSNVSTQFSNDPDQLIIDEAGMMFAVSIFQTNFSSSPYFNVTALQKSYIRHSNGTSTKTQHFIDLVPCTIDRFQKVFDSQGINFTSQYLQLGLNTWLCPAKGAQLSMKGLHSSTEFDFVKITVTQCINDTSKNQSLTWKPVCQSQDAIDKYLNSTGSFQIQFYSTDYILNAHQPTNYLQMYLNDEIFSTFVPHKMSKQTEIFFKKYNFANDESLTPLEDIELKSVIIKDINDFREKVELGNPADTQYAALFLRRSQFTVSVTRAYQKIGNLLSFLGGFVQFMITIFGVCVTYYNKQWLLVELANKLYDFKTDKKIVGNTDQDKKIDQKIQIKDYTKNNNYVLKIQGAQESKFANENSNQESQVNLMNVQSTPRVIINQNKVSSNILSVQEASKTIRVEGIRSSQEASAQKFVYKTRMEYLQYQFTDIINNKSSVLLTFRYVVSLLFCGKLFADKQCKLLEKAIDKISQDLDVFLLLDKINEIDKLKHLLLQKNQTILFNFTPKPTITLEEQIILPSRITVETNRLSGYNKIKRKSILVKDATKFSVSSEPVQESQDHDSDIEAYYLLQKAYERILEQNELGELTPDQIRINNELIKALGAELQNIFYISHHIKFQEDNFAQLENSDPITQSPFKVSQIKIESKEVFDIMPESPAPMVHEIEEEFFIDQMPPSNDIIQRRIGFKNYKNNTQQ